MKIRRTDLVRLGDLAKTSLLGTPRDARLLGDKTVLGQGERLALAYLEAVAKLLASEGQLIEIDVRFDDSES